MVFRRKRARRVLLRTSDDHAPGTRRAAESRDFLPWRPNYGAAERLDRTPGSPPISIGGNRKIKSISGVQLHLA